MTSREQVDEIARALRVFMRPGQLTELRALGLPEGPVAGWFDYGDIETMARHAAQLSPRARAVYFTINPIRPDADIPGLRRLGLGRVGAIGEGEGTADEHIERRLWIPIDVDPVRVNAPRRASAADAERAAAWAVLDRVLGALKAAGLCGAVVGDSGNGWHVCQPIDLPNDQRSRDRVRQLLYGLAAKCGDQSASVDKTTFNAARIWKVYGTAARKGEHTPERPHRMSRLIDLQPGANP